MRSQPLTFESRDALLAGEVVLPDGPGPHPGVVVLHGASWGERRFYAAFVERFAQAGIASLIYDRRGEGESSGSPGMNLYAYGDDAIAAFRALQGHPMIDRERVGLWGYSNGAWVAALAAEQLPDLAFVVLTGASGVSPAQAEAYRRTEDLRSQGIDGPTLAAVERAWDIILACVSGANADLAYAEELERLMAIIERDSRLDALPVPEFVRQNPELDSVPRLPGAGVREGLRQIANSSPDMAYDPIPSISATRCPVLVILAERDQNLPPTESAARFREAAASRKSDAEFRIEVLPTDHAFGARPASDRDPALQREPRRADDFLPGYLDLMATWMRDAVMVG